MLQRRAIYLGVLLVAIYSLGCSADSRIAMDGDYVSVHYTGTLDTGEEFDSSLGRDPLSFVLGSGNMIPGFDAAVHGMKIGDRVQVRMPAEEGYGLRRDDLIISFPIAQLPAGGTDGADVQFENGPRGVILEVNDSEFVVDLNHHLAGKALNFEIDLVSIADQP